MTQTEYNVAWRSAWEAASRQAYALRRELWAGGRRRWQDVAHEWARAEVERRREIQEKGINGPI